MYQAGTLSGNPIAMAAGLATFRDVLTPAAYQHVTRLNDRLVKGYGEQIARTGLSAYVVGAGSNGSLMFAPKPIRALIVP